MATQAGSALDVSTLAFRVSAEYLEMPGMSLTGMQAQRLWGMDKTRCDGVLAALVDVGFLRKTERGSFVRASSDGAPRSQRP